MSRSAFCFTCKSHIPLHPTEGDATGMAKFLASGHSNTKVAQLHKTTVRRLPTVAP